MRGLLAVVQGVRKLSNGFGVLACTRYYISMKSSTALVILALAAYMGFEAFAINKAKHRTKPDFIHNLLLETREAAALCRFGDADLQRRFELTLARVAAQHEDDLLEDEGLSETDAAQRLAEVEAAAVARVGQILAASNCTEQVMKDYFQRYRIYARRSD